MIFYLVETETGHRVYKTQAEAKSVSKDYIQIDVPTDKDGLLATLQEFYTMLDTVRAETLENKPESISQNPEPTIPLIPTKQQFEDAWDKFPLALQLHYAALAMEEARDRLPDHKT